MAAVPALFIGYFFLYPVGRILLLGLSELSVGFEPVQARLARVGWFTLWQAALIALVINVLGFFGGYVLSAIKRDRGVKDWGSIIEGHGGMLDRVDSLSFAAPVFFHIVRYWWT